MYPHFTNCFLSWFAWWGWMKEEKDVLYYLVEGFLGCSHCFIYALPHQASSKAETCSVDTLWGDGAKVVTSLTIYHCKSHVAPTLPPLPPSPFELLPMSTTKKWQQLK